MKIAPIHKEMQRHPEVFEPILLHTGQHYDERMSKLFFMDLNLPEPDIYLGVGSGSHAKQTAAVMVKFEEACISHNPGLVLVVGDVNSTLACSLVAAKLCIPVAHVEAGLRSFDRTMPEEINRIVTDSLSDILFTSEESGNRNLLREGVAADKIRFVGNVMIDSVKLFSGKPEDGVVTLEQYGLVSGEYSLLTLHRPANVDNAAALTNIVEILERVQEQIRVVFPIHPRTAHNLDRLGHLARIRSLPGLMVVDPIGYIEFTRLMMHSRFVITDSGGIQEETTYFGVPCLTVRENTERPSTVEIGTNHLVGTNRSEIEKCVRQIMSGKWKKGAVPPLWDGHTSERIISALTGWKQQQTST
jgi:UDP-N-acetylglucosamine 2-epimerase (non-hydrolysing)